MNNLNFHDMFPPDPKKETITEEMRLDKGWFEEAKKIETVEDLAKFVNHLLNDYNHDYGTCCDAIAACAVASAWLGANVQGITGNQAGFIMFEFIYHWTMESNECGIKIVDYDKFLFPQYEEMFDKTISKETWENIQKVARNNLEKEDDFVHPRVRAHWKKIVEGVVPFGYKVAEE